MPHPAALKEMTTATEGNLLQSQKNDQADTALTMAQAFTDRTKIKSQTQEGLLSGTRHTRGMLEEGGEAPLPGHYFSRVKALPISSSFSPPYLQFFMLLQYKQ